jgi:hypothetical protein
MGEIKPKQKTTSILHPSREAYRYSQIFFVQFFYIHKIAESAR